MITYGLNNVNITDVGDIVMLVTEFLPETYVMSRDPRISPDGHFQLNRSSQDPFRHRHGTVIPSYPRISTCYPWVQFK